MGGVVAKHRTIILQVINYLQLAQILHITPSFMCRDEWVGTQTLKKCSICALRFRGFQSGVPLGDARAPLENQPDQPRAEFAGLPLQVKSSY